jgi:6,7-dimethyl-8-ribityllumazine synthase
MASSGKSENKNAGTFIKKGACVVIVRTEWNSEIVDELEQGCQRILKESGVKNIVVLNIPGAVEIPYTIKHCWDKTKYQDNKPDAFIALGTVIQGDTPHFDYVCKMVADGILQLNLTLPVPTIFGVLTVNTKQQAMDRIGGKDGHKGEEAADAALKMIQLSETISNLNL